MSITMEDPIGYYYATMSRAQLLRLATDHAGELIRLRAEAERLEPFKKRCEDLRSVDIALEHVTVELEEARRQLANHYQSPS